MSSKLIVPDYYRIIECCEGRWFFKAVKPFHTLLPITIDYEDTELLYGISKQQVINQAAQFRSGEEGFYLVNMRRKRYYYCGLEADSVKVMLLSLGVGRSDRQE